MINPVTISYSEATTLVVSLQKNDSPTVIYRLGSGNATNLTPRQKDIGGLSYQLTMPTSGAFTMTTIEAINATGMLIAKKDASNHVSVLPDDITKMQEWIDSRPTALTDPHLYTIMLQSLSIIVK